MARYERDPRPAAGAPPAPGRQQKVVMRRDPEGHYHAVVPEHASPTPETRAEARPPQADDPRPAIFRNVPPYAGGAG